MMILENRKFQMAEVLCYFGMFDDAEKEYISVLNRPDLAIEMRSKIGDWFGIERLCKDHGCEDRVRLEAWNGIGDYYIDRHEWSKAAKYFSKAKNSEKLAHCLMSSGDIPNLEKLVGSLSESSRLLKPLAENFQRMGLCHLASSAFGKTGEVQHAVDACILLGEWSLAVDIMENKNTEQMDGLIRKHALQLQSEGRHMEAIELYRNGGRHIEAARILMELAKVEAKKLIESPLKMKKLQVLIALEVEEFRKGVLNNKNEYDTYLTALGTVDMTKAATAQTLAGLMTLDAVTVQGDTRNMDNAWHSAEAYHFWALAQRQLQRQEAESAMRTALHLRSYEDVLSSESIYSLLALASCCCSYFEQASKAFMKLESLQLIERERRERYATLAASIFMTNPPNDPRIIRETRKQRSNDLKDLLEENLKPKAAVCVRTGRSIRSKDKVIKCKVCKHSTILDEVYTKRLICALCHSEILSEGDSTARTLHKIQE